MKRILKKAHAWFYVIMVSVFFILLYPALYFFSRKPGRYKTLNKFRYVFALISSTVAGFLYQYTFEEKLKWDKPCIICPNHTSNLDISAITILMRANFAFLGKEELLSNPITRLFFTTIDIALNRDSKISSFRAFKKAEGYAKNGMSLVIFPEGKIADDYPPVLQPFKNGPFRLAIEQGMPVIPVSIVYAWGKMWDDGMKYGTKPGITHIFVHKPVETKGMSIEDADLLKEQVFNIIHSKLSEHEA